jgi:hypothetical protein
VRRIVGDSAPVCQGYVKRKRYHIDAGVGKGDLPASSLPLRKHLSLSGDIHLTGTGDSLYFFQNALSLCCCHLLKGSAHKERETE